MICFRKQLTKDESKFVDRRIGSVCISEKNHYLDGNQGVFSIGAICLCYRIWGMDIFGYHNLDLVMRTAKVFPKTVQSICMA